MRVLRVSVVRQDKRSVLDPLRGAADAPWKRKARSGTRMKESMLIATVNIASDQKAKQWIFVQVQNEGNTKPEKNGRD